VWFQKISIPLPRREFHLEPPSYNSPIPLDFPQYDKHPLLPSGKFRSRRESVKNKATEPSLIEEFPLRVPVLLINVTLT